MKKSKSGLWHGLTALFATLCAIMIGLSVVAFQYEIFIDGALGLQSIQLFTQEVEGQDTIYYKSDFNKFEDLIAFREGINKRVGEESAALLKNINNALPLNTSTSATAKVTMFGVASVDPSLGGSTGARYVVAGAANQTSFKDAFAAEGIVVNPTVWNFYSTMRTDNAAKYSRVNGSKSTGALRVGEVERAQFDTRSELAASFSEYNKAAICVVARESGESFDIPFTTDLYTDHDGSSPLELNQAEKDMITLAKTCSDKVIVLINSNSAMEIKGLKDDADVDAILWIGQPGLRGLEGVAEVISGKANASGKLPHVYAAKALSAPATINAGDIAFSNEASITATTGKTSLVYAEGIYIGYHYYETRYEDAVLGRGNASDAAGASSGTSWSYANEMAYSFGYGQSYTTFTQEFVGQPDINADTIKFEVRVTNTGSKAGKSVVQIYSQSPYTPGGIEKAAIQLLTFDKTKTLAPGANALLTISVPTKYLASYDETNAKTYVLENGNYYFALGNGAHDALNNVLASKDKKVSDGMDYVNANYASMVRTWNHGGHLRNAFSVSDNGILIENQFGFADYNKYVPNKIKYLSRNDWKETWPKKYNDLEATAVMLPELKASAAKGGALIDPFYTVRETDTSSAVYGQEGELKLLNFRGRDYNDPLWDQLLRQLTLEELVIITKYCGPGLAPLPSVGWLGAPKSANTWKPADGALPPAGADGQSGMSSILPGGTLRIDDAENPVIPYHLKSTDPLRNYSLRTLHAQANLAATFSPELAREHGKVFGNDSLWTNDICSSWSVGLNLHRTAFAGRNFEYLSEDPMLSNIIGVNMITAAAVYGHNMMPKHFVMNDQEVNRQSHATWFREQTIRETYMRAFEGPLSPNEGRALGVMSAFNRIGYTQAALCSQLQIEVLRSEWGYQGYVITDMAQDAIHLGRVAIVNGTDAMLNAFATFIDMTVENMETDLDYLLSAQRAAKNTMFMFLNSNVINGIAEDSYIVNLVNWWEIFMIALPIVFGLLAAGGCTMYVLGLVKKNKEVS